MSEFLDVILGMPTLPWTALLALASIYWASVIAGALDVDALGGPDSLGEGHHVGDGHAHEVSGKADVNDGVLTALLSVLRLRNVPITISLSLLGLAAWVSSCLLTLHVVPSSPLPLLVSQLLVFLVSLAGGTLFASLAGRPLAPLFKHRSGPAHQDLVGKVVRVTTGRVDGKFGEGLLEDGGAGLQLQVRCADPDALRRDDEALILGWNAESQTFDVEPMSQIEGRTRPSE